MRRRGRVGIAEEWLHIVEQQLTSAVRQHQREVGQIAQMRTNFGGSGDSRHPVRCVRQLALDDAFILELGRGDGEDGTRMGALHLCAAEGRPGNHSKEEENRRGKLIMSSRIYNQSCARRGAQQPQSIRARREAFQLTSTDLHPGPCPLI